MGTLNYSALFAGVQAEVLSAVGAILPRALVIFAVVMAFRLAVRLFHRLSETGGIGGDTGGAAGGDGGGGWSSADGSFSGGGSEPGWLKYYDQSDEDRHAGLDP